MDKFLIVCDVRDTRYVYTKKNMWAFFEPGMNDHLWQFYGQNEGLDKLNTFSKPSPNSTLKLISYK